MNKLRFVFVIFNMLFAAYVDGNELESHHACAEVVVFVLHVLLLTSEVLVRR